jgi:hypothetical protein
LSADNGIYIGWFGEKDFRVIHAQAIDNVFYPDGENAEAIVEYFGDAIIYDTIGTAQDQAFKMADEIQAEYGVLEYGISTLKFSKSFEDYAEEMNRGR